MFLYNTYDVYCNAPIGRLIAVKRGFSWWGFLFTWAWLFRSGLRVRGFFLFLLFVCHMALIFGALPQPLDESTKAFIPDFLHRLIFLYPYAYAFAINPLIRLIIGFCGNNWRRKHLLARGCEHVEAVRAISKAVACYSDISTPI